MEKMIEKFAIFNSTGKEENSGGPKGYIYNLIYGCEQNNYVVNFISMDNNKSSISHQKNKSKRKEIKMLYGIKYFLYFIKKGIKMKRKIKNECNNYSIIHVHSSEDVYYLRKFLKYKGKIIFTPHRPEKYSSECITLANKVVKGRHIIIKKIATHIEKKSYKMANAFIFPSENSRKIYFEFPGFKKYALDKPVKYIFTGTIKKNINISKNEYRKRVNISNDDFVISFIGRHNKIKGYDLLKSLEKELSISNIMCVCAGNNDIANNEPLSDKWKELGYITNVNELMNAVDVIVIPNRNTYFDLIIIEALSLGKIVITSNTGGNIDIARKTKGLILFEKENSRDLFKKIKEIKNMNSNEKKILETENIDFYNKYCNPKSFGENYINVIKEFQAEMK